MLVISPEQLERMKGETLKNMKKELKEQMDDSLKKGEGVTGEKKDEMSVHRDWDSYRLLLQKLTDLKNDERQQKVHLPIYEVGEEGQRGSADEIPRVMKREKEDKGQGGGDDEEEDVERSQDLSLEQMLDLINSHLSGRFNDESSGGAAEGGERMPAVTMEGSPKSPTNKRKARGENRGDNYDDDFPPFYSTDLDAFDEGGERADDEAVYNFAPTSSNTATSTPISRDTHEILDHSTVYKIKSVTRFSPFSMYTLTDLNVATPIIAKGIRAITEEAANAGFGIYRDVTGIDQFGYYSYINSLLNFSKDATETFLTTSMFYLDSPEAINTAGDENQGFKKRKEQLAGGKTCQLFGRLRCGFFKQPLLLPPGLDLRVKLTFATENFYMWAAEDANINLRVTDATLHCKNVIDTRLAARRRHSSTTTSFTTTTTNTFTTTTTTTRLTCQHTKHKHQHQHQHQLRHQHQRQHLPY
ncbi:hypothetical protein ONE63_009431 [Megalurothrips usitatus]|uniref:Uncharacterized protein n=1 Tax=Megalurothrips usitatus TaxID=439358 RepID=A0AAV7XMY4_9NEOP|nr:hypothetical protein ONE63_009431 [Megalurothrips usitatus]